jgi:hypothetical protein
METNRWSIPPYTRGISSPAATSLCFGKGSKHHSSTIVIPLFLLEALLEAALLSTGWSTLAGNDLTLTRGRRRDGLPMSFYHS